MSKQSKRHPCPDITQLHILGLVGGAVESLLENRTACARLLATRTCTPTRLAIFGRVGAERSFSSRLD
jgi:hypothetical protein